MGVTEGWGLLRVGRLLRVGSLREIRGEDCSQGIDGLDLIPYIYIYRRIGIGVNGGRNKWYRGRRRMLSK